MALHYTGFSPKLRHSTSYGSSISITAESGALKVNTPYNASFVAELKSLIPASGRKWDQLSKCWLVSPDHAARLKDIIDRNYGSDVAMPTVIAAKAEEQVFEFKADYVANVRDGFASVNANGSWAAKLTEAALRQWFRQPSTPGEAATFYSLLGIDRDAPLAEIKKAYKRAARQWHPDVNREPEAREMFEHVKEAYEILSEPESRTRYNAGLLFEQMARIGKSGTYAARSTFTPNLRCGQLKVRGRQELGTVIGEEILAWDDITNEAGSVMVSFWAGETFQIVWV